MSTLRKSKIPFTQASNEILNHNLSLKAIGLYLYIASKPDGWNFTYRAISSQLPNGETSIASAMKELKELGFVTYTKYADGTGEYTLYHKPKGENINVGKAKMPKRPPISNTISLSNTISEGNPEEQEVITIGKQLGISENACIQFYLYYESRKWRGVLDFVPLLRKWDMNQKPEEKGKEEQKGGVTW